MTAAELPHIPVLRLGQAYESLELTTIADLCGGAPVARISQANAGILRRDLKRLRAAREAMAAKSSAEMIAICKQAGELFLSGTLPLDPARPAATQSPADYIRCLSATCGLPLAMIRRNMDKIHYVLTHMDAILAGLTRGMDLAVLDAGFGAHNGVPVSYFPQTDALGVVLPSNSPGVNSLWLPAVALKIPVILKPGREEPWTPLRLIQALIQAGAPAQGFGFYPTDHDGAQQVLQLCGRGLAFGDQSTVERYAHNPAIQVHGPGYSKIWIGPDRIERWRDYLDLIVASVADNGGRSCINASCLLVPKHGREIAAALAEKLAAIRPRGLNDPQAQLAGFANPKMAAGIQATIEEGLKMAGAVDMTAAARNEPRLTTFEAAHFLLPTVVYCERWEHPLANREFLFPYVSVVEMTPETVLERIGPTLVLTAITADAEFLRRLYGCAEVERLNVGPVATTRVQWDQPHEGNLFEFLYKRRAIQHASA